MPKINNMRLVGVPSNQLDNYLGSGDSVCGIFELPDLFTDHKQKQFAAEMENLIKATNMICADEDGSRKCPEGIVLIKKKS